ncbi:MAG: GNAT family N-acetyltransferase [Caldilineaceae bacterium]
MQLHKSIRQKIADQHLFFWEDGEPVSMVALARPTAHGIGIGPVYTPPQYRGRGYASSAVAQLSQQMLDTGKEFCALFTDVANPTSNHIYQAIGYRALVDFQVYRFAG